eukprot:1417558-Prymnesium_polylepis.1
MTCDDLLRMLYEPFTCIRAVHLFEACRPQAGFACAQTFGGAVRHAAVARRTKCAADSRACRLVALT